MCSRQIERNANHFTSINSTSNIPFYFFIHLSWSIMWNLESEEVKDENQTVPVQFEQSLFILDIFSLSEHEQTLNCRQLWFIEY